MTTHPVDPRSKNVWYDAASPMSYLTGYRAALASALSTVDPVQFERACTALAAAAQSGRRVYAFGNGGSAAIADHLCCDWTKGTHTAPHPTIRTHSLSSNGALLLAVANDFGFNESFAKQVEFYADRGDLIVAISSSGNSENISNAVIRAKKAGATVIGLTGFTGGRLRVEADIPLHIEASNYGIVEDAHQSLMHAMAQYITSKREGR